MRFGKAENNTEVNYSLQSDHKSLTKILGGTKVSAPNVYVGGVLWADEKFKGFIYPKNAKPADYLKYYAQQFNTIELNSTHYRVPGPETFKRWLDVAPEEFKFCPKINQTISHADSLISMIRFHNECAHLFELLQNKLGTCFMQLPPHFSPNRLNELLEFLDNSELQNLAIELRHEDWFRKETEFNLLCNYLYKNKMALVITDTPGRRDAVHMRLTNTTAFVRFKSNNDLASDKQRIHEWIDRAKGWFDSGLKEFYFFVHTTNKADMPYLATLFIGRLEEVCGIKLNPPKILKGDSTGDLF